MAGCMVVGVWLGHWADGKFGTKPWLLLTGCLLGIVSGFYHFFKVVLRNQKENNEENNNED
jgi:F0F1-type ATP synthase assembly protein I